MLPSQRVYEALCKCPEAPCPVHPTSNRPFTTRTPTVEVYVRHSADCPKIGKGRDFRGCSCMKWLYVNDQGKATRESAKTRSWEEAERKAQAVRDSYDPVKRELVRMKVEQEKRATLIIDAVKFYLDDKRVGGRAQGTMEAVHAAISRTIQKKGHTTNNVSLLEFLEPRRVIMLSEISPMLLLEWRGGWQLNETTTRNRWIEVLKFFNFCVRHKLLPENPAKSLAGVKLRKVSLTVPFTDEQYEAVLKATDTFRMAHWLEPGRAVIMRQRMRAFTEAMRWTAMSLIDVLNLRPDMIVNGVLRYKRHKTGVQAVVPLPSDLLSLLATVPSEPRSVEGYYFLIRGDGRAIRNAWRARLRLLFQQAGIASVRTELRDRPPHPHMFRDTMAVYYINQGLPLPDISRMLGHSNTMITERAYLPWVQSREDAMINRVRIAQGLNNAPRKAIA